MTTFPFNNSTFVLHSLLQEGETIPCFSTYPHPNTDETPISASVTDKSKTDSSSMVVEFDSDDPKETCMEKRRKNKDGSCLSSAQSQDKRGIKTRKQRKCSTSRKEETEKKKTKLHQEPPTDYIHVRARRGQATDSHSLAERVRREKISERMRLLQGLVPGCDKVTGKAPMLDEIINYVQSLQYQVEFLSMKLASVNPVVHDFATDINALMVKPERISGSMGASSASVLPSMQQQSNLSQPFADMIATSTTKNNSFLPQQQGQMLVTAFSQEDNANMAWDVYDQRQRLVNQYSNNNLCSFSFQ